MNSKEIIEKFALAWERNSFDDFTNIFSANAQIYHPYFEKPITAVEAMEVMNTAVSGSSTVEKIELIEGDGQGVHDKVRIEVSDTGSRIQDVSYVGVMPIEVTIEEGKILCIHIEKGYYKKLKEKKKRTWNKQIISKYNIKKCIDTQSTLGLAILLARYWGTNCYKEFLSLFSEHARIRHIMYEDEADPMVIMDVMNSNVLGTTKLYGFEIIQGDGSGKKDVAFLKFIETGDMIGYIPEQQGVMKIKVYVKENQIEYLDVLGYEITYINKEVVKWNN